MTLDCFLPDVNGVALCRVLRRHAPSLPIIVISGCDGREKEIVAEKARTVFLPKPFYPRQVQDLRDQLLATQC